MLLQAGLPLRQFNASGEVSFLEDKNHRLIKQVLSRLTVWITTTATRSRNDMLQINSRPTYTHSQYVIARRQRRCDNLLHQARTLCFGKSKAAMFN